MLALITLPILPLLVHISRHTSRFTVITWAKSDVRPARNRLNWLIDHDWLVGGVLCALPVVIVIVILVILGI